MQTRRPFSYLLLTFVLGLIATTAQARPPAWKNNVMPLQWQGDGTTQSFNFQSFLQTVPASDLSFVINWTSPTTTMPSWATFNTNINTTDANAGLFTGHPQNADAGVYTFTVAPIYQGDSGSLMTVTLTVVAVANCGNTKSVALGKSPENVSFNKADVGSACTDPTGAALTYAIHADDPTHAAWKNGTQGFASLDANTGAISWNPLWNAQHDKVAAYNVSVDIKTASGGVVNMPVSFEVTRFFKPAVWTTNPIALGTAAFDDGELFSLHLDQYVQVFETRDGVGITYGATNQPTWLTASGSTLSGTPSSANLGAVSFPVTFTETDSVTSSPYNAGDTVTFTVVHKPVKPVCDVDATAGLDLGSTNLGAVTYNLATHCKDPSGQDTLTYAFTSGDPTWATVAASGVTAGTMKGTALVANIGVNTWHLVVTNASNTSLSTTFPVKLLVKKQAVAWDSHAITETPNAVENQTWSADLNPHVLNPDGPFGGKYTCTQVGTSWVTVTSDCKVSGTPTAAQIGTQTFQVQVSDGTNTPDVTTITIGVTGNHPPTCVGGTNNPLTPDPKERAAYSNSAFLLQTTIASDVTYQSQLKYSLVSGPAWFKVATNGTITGTPARADVTASPETVVVLVTNPVNQTCQATLKVTVDKDARAPVCTALSLDSQSRIPFTGVLTANAKDQDGEKLTYGEATLTPPAPAWLVTDATGNLSGTPPDLPVTQQLLTQNFVFTATNEDGLSCQIPTAMNIHFQAHPPVPNTSAMTFTVKERTTPSFDLTNQTPTPPNTLPYISNPDGTKLTCAPADTSNPAFVTITADCQLQMAPTRKDVSATPYTYKFLVTPAGGTAVTAVAKITVIKDPRAPQCTDVADSAIARVKYTGSVVKGATDLDGETLTFAQTTTTPPWLTSTAAGATSGTPTDADVTALPEVFAFTATNEDSLSCTFNLNLTVNFNPHPPVPNSDVMAFTVKERSVTSYKLGDWTQPNATKPYITNPDHTVLTCKAQTVGFIALAADCTLTLSPQRKDIGGPTAFNFTFSGGTFNNVAATASITVIKDPRAPQCTNVADTATARVKYTGSVVKGATDLDGETVTFAQTTTTPPWLTSTAAGVTSGTPTDSDVTTAPATETFAFTATNQDNMSCSFNLNTTVKFNPHPPVPNADVMTFTVKERTVTSYKLGDWTQPNEAKPYITNPDHIALTCVPQTSGFIALAADCTLTLSPQRKDVGGPTSFAFVYSGGTFTNQPATASITVTKDPRDPNCTPITLSAAARKAFAGSLAGGAVDLDGETLSYTKKVATPAWLVSTSTGVLSGTPSDDDQAASPEAFVFTATNQDNRSCDINVTVNISKTPHDIVVNPMAFTVKERATLTAGLADPNQPSAAAPYIVNQDHATLTCTLVSGPAFLKLDAQCNLTLTPQHGDVRDAAYPFSFTVAGGPNTPTGNGTVTVLRDPRPPVWNPTSLSIVAVANQAFTGSVAGSATDPDSYALTYTLKNCPAWLKVNATSGALSGTPAETDVAVNTCAVTAANPYLSADASLKVKVILLKWTANPVVLPQVRVGDPPYSQSLASFVVVKDPENANDTVTFSKTTATAVWAALSAAGQVTGSPASSDVGLNKFTAKVTDLNKATASAEIDINVLKALTPPGWNTNPIQLPDATQDTPYSTAVSQYITNPDNLPITCAKAPDQNGVANGPAWLTVNSDCTITGTPAKADITDKYNVVLQVSDGQHTPATVPAFGRVLPLWLPPTITQPIDLTVKERQSVTVLFVPQYIQSANDGDTLTCSLTSLTTHLSWLKMASDCSVTMTPQHPDIGNYTVNFQATNAHGQTKAGVFTVHVLRDPQKPVCPANLTFTTQAMSLFSQTVGAACHDLDNMALTYTATSPPGWLAFNTAGNMLGTPQETDVGTKSFTVTASNDGGAAFATSFTVTIIVTTSLIPPICTNPIVLPHAKVSKTYIQSIASYCRDPLGGTLTFTEQSAADWATFSTSGSVIGTPKMTDVGDHQYTVRVRNSKSFVDITVEITVDPLAPPGWKQDPINLGKQIAGQLWQFDLNPYITNPDNGPYTCTKVSNTGPAWMFVSADCKVSGTPQLADVGQYTVQFSVNNGGPQSAVVNAYGEVIKIDLHIVPNSMVFTVKANSVGNFNLNSPTYVSAPDGDVLSFRCIDCEPWAVLTTSGALTLSPKLPQVGDHTYQVMVTDKYNLTAQGPMLIHVLKPDPLPPVCPSPQTFTAHVGQSFVNALTCTDPSNTGLTFSKTWDSDSPIWLSVSGKGTLSGTPGTPNVGADQYMVTVTNGNGDTTDITVIINVNADTPHDDVIAVDDSVPWATPVAENLWVLDSAGQCGQQSTLIKNFKSSMHLYFDDLDAGHVEHTGVYIASNQSTVNGVKSLTGKPVPSQTGSNILAWNDNHLIEDFQERIDRYKPCPCYNSPVWAEFLFYTKYLTGMSEFGKTWFLPKVPMDTVIVTDHADYYQYYSQNTAQEDWSSTDYLAKTFVPPHTQQQKPYRINVIAPKCLQPNGTRSLSASHDPGNDNADPVTELTDSLYNQLTTGTGGHYWELDCKYKIDTALTALGDQVKFRALVVSKTAIPLSQKPADPSKIQVLIGGVPLSSDKWQYDPVKNVINIFWDKIDLTTITPGEKIDIKYTA